MGPVGRRAGSGRAGRIGALARPPAYRSYLPKAPKIRLYAVACIPGTKRPPMAQYMVIGGRLVPRMQGCKLGTKRPPMTQYMAIGGRLVPSMQGCILGTKRPPMTICCAVGGRLVPRMQACIRGTGRPAGAISPCGAHWGAGWAAGLPVPPSQGTENPTRCPCRLLLELQELPAVAYSRVSGALGGWDR